jgi:prepilin-type N-terminal cleavage/methylation domain-containing protein
MKNNKGFTRIELLIVMLILGILSISALPIYKEYVKKSIVSEGKALLALAHSAEKIYYEEFGDFYEITIPVSYDAVLDIDARNNKTFKTYNVRVSNNTDPKTIEIITYGKNREKDIIIILKGSEDKDDIEIIEKM